MNREVAIDCMSEVHRAGFRKRLHIRYTISFTCLSMEAAERGAARAHSQRTRRPRAARACDRCRAKKNKCDELYPCSYCKSRDVTCVYQGQQPGSRRYTAEYVKQLEDLVRHLSTLPVGSPNVPYLVQFNQSMSENYGPQNQSDATPQQSTSAPVREAVEGEISEVNRHTQDVEFYGSSSSFALLSQIQCTGQRLRDDEDRAQLVSRLHNPAFRTTPSASPRDASDTDVGRAHHYPQCRSFVENFFSTIHYIHPILDKQAFMERCEVLWSRIPYELGNATTSSFVALYYSILSLGAIVGVRQEEPIDGLSNLQWSRKFFEIARMLCNQLGLVTDLEMVQCFFMMVCGVS